ncbi:MAG: hypothetical protein OXT70_14020 [Chloroflexota bacterium]|nr:hypothetical protein [Chloroflexota bacterium]
MSLGAPLTPPPHGPRNLVRLVMWEPQHEALKRTLTWFTIGAATAALMGWALLEILPSTMQTSASDIREITQQALSAAYIAEYDDAYPAAVTERLTYELAQLVVGSDADVESAWAEGVRRGWADGWNDALDAMRAASTEAGAATGSSEQKALNAAPRRDPVH